MNLYPDARYVIPREYSNQLLICIDNETQANIVKYDNRWFRFEVDLAYLYLMEEI
jgi:hypothetical protein